MNKTSQKRYFFSILVIFIACILLGASLTFAQNMTYTVQKGDTLWDICEKHYGDPDLWPKLWQMNPFVTNPHLLTPGDVLTLWEKEPAPVAEIVYPVEKEGPDITETEPAAKGINVGELTDLRTLGYLSSAVTETWGKIFATDTGRILLAKGDNAFVFFDKSKEINVGDEFSVCKQSELIKDPVTGEDAGYALSVLGRMTIEEPAGLIFKEEELVQKENVYRAKVTEVYRPIYTDSVVTSYKGSVLPCVMPKSLDKYFLGNIAATKDERQLIGQYSVVYINHGFNDGLSRGNLLKAVKGNIAKNPDLNDRPGALEMPPPVILPDIEIGTILILETRPDSATGLVIDAKEEFGVGTFVTNFSWIDTPEIISSIAECPVE